jgi:serine/threonine protein kinase/DNA-binding SARP family transcriptional activator/WD40 repeat protein
MSAPDTVSIAKLMDGLWGEDPPTTAKKTLHGYIHHLRAALPDAITTEGAGYRLDIDVASIDAVDFEAMVMASRTLARSDPARASITLIEALGLWYGQPYADLDGSLALDPEIVRLRDLRITAVEDRIAIDLEAGRARDVVSELESLTRDYPLRERLHALHMRALYMSGRQADALRAYERTRAYLADELGLDPSPELRELEVKILNQDPALDGSAEQVDEGGPRALRGYEVRDRFEAASGGAVYRAYQTSVGRQVALKAYPSSLANEPAFIAGFAEECIRIGMLEHPHLVTLHDAWREPGSAYQVRRWMEGGDLRSRLEKERLSVSSSMRLLDDVCSVVAYAHRQGVVHCRIQPSNILFDGEGEAYISDFAIAGTEALPVGPGDACYLAPELTDRTGAHIPASDVFSLGVLAFELLSGTAPDLDDSGHIASFHGISDACVPHIQRAIDPDPTRRQPKVEDLIRGLRQAVGVDVGPVSSALTETGRSPVRNPYKGLRAFQEADAADFFGRAGLVQRLEATVRARNFVAVVGPSGIGKSSIVKAGLIPSIRERRSDDEPLVLVTEMFPGSHPFEELESALLRVAVERPVTMMDDLIMDDRGLLRVSKQILPDDGSELLLVIDQFEELFSLVVDESQRALFMANLVTATSDERSRIRVVVTLRADFYDKPLEYHEFGSLLEFGTVPVMMPSPDELAQTVARPAKSVGLEFEAGLVGLIVSDVSDQPGGLPLMQYALTELVERRTSNVLSVAEYKATGGVLGSLGTRAEELWRSLSSSGKEATRQAFLRLVTIEESNDDVRRRVRWSELSTLGVSQGELTSALSQFGAHRLLSFDRDPVTRSPTIEVAHEALFREWSRLRRWIETHREDLIVQRQLAGALSEWETAGRDDSYLLRGGRLAHFDAWANATEISLTAPEAEFLESSRVAGEAEDRRERASRTRLKRMLVVASLLAIVAIGAGIIAYSQGRRAQEKAIAATASREAAETRRLALQAPQLADTNRQVALLLAVEAVRRDPGAVSVGALQEVLVRSSRGFRGYVGSGEQYQEIAFASDGQLVALNESSLSVIDSETGRIVQQTPAVNASNLAVSPVARMAAYANVDGVKLVDLATGSIVGEFIGPGSPQVTALAFDLSGSRVAIGQRDGAVTIYDVQGGSEVLRISDAHPERDVDGLEVPPHQPGRARIGTQTVAFSDDGSRLVTGGLVFARIWDIESGAMIDSVLLTRRQVEGPRVAAAVEAVGFVGTGNEVVHVASSFNVIDYRVGSGRVDPSREREFPDKISAVGGVDTIDQVLVTRRFAILAEEGGRVAVLDHDTSRPTVFDSQLSAVTGIAASNVNDSIAVGGREAVAIWSPSGNGLITTSLPRGGSAEITFNSDGSMAVLSSGDTRPPVVYSLSGGAAQKVALPEEPASHYAWMGPADGLLTWSFDDAVLRYRPFGDLASEGLVLGATATVAIAVSLDGQLVAVSGGPPNGTPEVRVYDLTTGNLIAENLDELVATTPDSSEATTSLSFNPDASRLIGATTHGASVVWDTTSWEAEVVLSQGGGQIAIAEYSPDGQWLVTVSSDGTTLLRDPETFQPVGSPLVGQVGSVEGFSHGPSFSESGRYMVTTSDGSGRIWDLEVRSLVGSAFPSDPGASPGTSGDGRWLGTFDGDQVIVWDLNISSWPDIACRAAGRNLTSGEWDQFGPPGEPYSATCDMWPAAQR